MRFPVWFRDASLRRKFIFIALLATGGAMLFAMLLSTLLQWFMLREELVKSISSQASVIASISTTELISNNRAEGAKTVKALANIENIEFAGILDKRGNNFALYVRPGLVMRPHHHQQTEGAHHIDTVSYIEVVVPVISMHEEIGMIHIRSSMAPVYEKLEWNLLITFAAASGAFLVAVMMLLYLLPAITNPLHSLIGLMKNVSRDNNFTLRSELHGNDETGTLAKGFNTMLEHIQQRDNELARHREQLEEEVAKRTARLTEAQRIAHIGNWEWDVVNNTLEWSDEIYRIFGLTPQQFSPTYESFIQTVHPQDRQALDISIRETLEMRKPYNIEHRILLLDGTIRYVHEQGEVFRDQEGKPVRMLGTVQDITEEKLAEEKLKDANEQLSLLLNSLPIAVYRCQAEGDFSVTYMSDNVLSFTGYTPQNFIEKTDLWLTHIHPDDAPKMDAEIALLFEKGVHSYEYRWLSADGTYIWIQDSLKLIDPEDGTPIYMVGMWQDITEHKRIEEKIRKQQKLTEQIIETIPLRVFWKDHDLRYLGCNTLFAKDAGLTSPDQLIGKDDFDMTWKDQAELYRADDRHVMDSNRYKLSYDEPQTTPEGKHIWLRTSKVPLHNDANETIGMLGVYEDITPYKESEEKLRESEARYRAIFEHADDIIYLLSSEGIFNSLSPSFELITGWKPEEWIGKPFAPIIHPNDLPLANDVFHNVLSGQSTPIFELRIVKKTGEYFHSELSLVPVSPGGEIAAIGIARDVTLRKNSEQILEESERKFRTILDVAVDGVLLADVEAQKFISGNRAICDMLGYLPEELYELGVQDIHPAEALPEVFRQFERQMRGEILVAQNLPVKRKDGSVFLADVSSAPMVLEGRTIMVGFFHDVTERKRIEEEIKLLATTDSLTGIANRREFSMQLEKEIERAKRYGTPLSLVMYDIDYFKRVNDTFGHDAGDAVLQTLTTVVKTHIRAVDVVARWGGEEFLILMPQSDGTAARDAAEKLRQEIAQCLFEGVGSLTVSFGVTVFTPEDDSNTFLKRVDDALYQAKENGRNRVVMLTGNGYM